MTIEKELPAQLREHLKWVELPGNSREGFRSVVMPEQRLVYMPVAKCAMSSMEDVLKVAGVQRKSRSRIIHQGRYPTIPNSKVRQLPADWTIFAIVRHPLARAISCYTDRTNKKSFQEKYSLPAVATIKQFVDRVCETPDTCCEKHVISQTTYLIRNGRALPHVLIPFSRLPYALEQLMASRGLPATMSHRRKSLHSPWQDAFSSRQQQQLRERYAADFSNFTFGE